MISEEGIREVCPHDKCANKDCTLGGLLGGFPSVAYRNVKSDTVYMFHIGCAPPRLRRFYYARERNLAS